MFACMYAFRDDSKRYQSQHTLRPSCSRPYRLLPVAGEGGVPSTVFLDEERFVGLFASSGSFSQTRQER